MLEIAPEGIAPEGIAPEPSVVVKLEPSESTTTGGGENFRIYEQEIGALTPMIADALKDAEQVYSAAWVADAIREASQNNKRNWKYCEAILKRWKIEGRQSRKTKVIAKGKTLSDHNQDVIRKVAAHA